MLRIIVQLVPGGAEHRKREIGRAELSNLSGLAACSDYSIEACEGPNGVTGARAWASRGMLSGHNREQSVFFLVAKAAAWAAGEAEKQS